MSNARHRCILWPALLVAVTVFAAAVYPASVLCAAAAPATTRSVRVTAAIDPGEAHGYVLAAGPGPTGLVLAGAPRLLVALHDAAGGWQEVRPLAAAAPVVLDLPDGGPFRLVLSHLDGPAGPYTLTVTRAADDGDLQLTEPPPRLADPAAGARWQRVQGSAAWEARLLSEADPDGEPWPATLTVGPAYTRTATALPARLGIPDTRALGEGLHSAALTLTQGERYSSRRWQVLVDDWDTFLDVAPDHWARGSVEMAAELGLAGGYTDGSFRPEQPVTRAEYIKLLSHAVGLYVSPPDRPTFADVDADHWAFGFVEAAAVAGISTGEPGAGGRLYFHPHRTLSRAEAATFAARAAQLAAPSAAPRAAPTAAPEPPADLPFTDAAAVPAWAAGPVAAAAAAGLVAGFPDGTFRPAEPVSRAQAAVMALRLVR